VSLWSGVCLGLVVPAGGAGFARSPRPTRTSAISVIADGSKVWVVNHDSVTVKETADDSAGAANPSLGARQ